MKFEFGKYTEITEFYKKHSLSLQDGDGYTRFFICPDTHVFWLIRVLEGFNEEYEKEVGTFLLERDSIDKDYRGQSLNTSKLKQIIDDDDFSNWDVSEYRSMGRLLDDIDGGFGILNLSENKVESLTQHTD